MNDKSCQLASDALRRASAPRFLLVAEQSYDAKCMAASLEAIGCEVLGPYDYLHAVHLARSATLDAAVLMNSTDYLLELEVASRLSERSIPFFSVARTGDVSSSVFEEEIPIRLPISLNELKTAIREHLPAAIVDNLDFSRTSAFFDPNHVFGE